MTTYRVPVADPLLLERDSWLPVEGFRLISADGPWLAHPDVTICTFEDDNAPAALEGKLVDLVMTRESADGPVRITGRTVLAP
jgi:hypothetical protein